VYAPLPEDFYVFNPDYLFLTEKSQEKNGDKIKFNPILRFALLYPTGFALSPPSFEAGSMA
jgi:hypothetical protein